MASGQLTLTPSPQSIDVFVFWCIIVVVVVGVDELSGCLSLSFTGRIAMAAVAGSQHPLADHLVGNGLQVSRPAEPCEEVEEGNREVAPVAGQLRNFVVPP